MSYGLWCPGSEAHARWLTEKQQNPAKQHGAWLGAEKGHRSNRRQTRSRGGRESIWATGPGVGEWPLWRRWCYCFIVYIEEVGKTLQKFKFPLCLRGYYLSELSSPWSMKESGNLLASTFEHSPWLRKAHASEPGWEMAMERSRDYRICMISTSLSFEGSTVPNTLRSVPYLEWLPVLQASLLSKEKCVWTLQ